MEFDAPDKYSFRKALGEASVGDTIVFHHHTRFLVKEDSLVLANDQEIAGRKRPRRKRRPKVKLPMVQGRV